MKQDNALTAVPQGDIGQFLGFSKILFSFVGYRRGNSIQVSVEHRKDWWKRVNLMVCYYYQDFL